MLYAIAIAIGSITCMVAVVPTAFAFHAGSATSTISTVIRSNTRTRLSPARLRVRLVALQLAADNNNESGGENSSSSSSSSASSSSSSSARKTQSLTSPVRKTDRRSPTRIIAKPSANARSTMTLGGDKVAAKKTTTTKPTTNEEGKAATGGGGFLGGSYAFEDFKPPFAETSVQLENGLVNDGPFAWMVPYLALFGFRNGKSLVGAIPTDPQASPDYDTLKLTQKEISERSAAAERDLTNISPEERERRAEVAQVALKVCSAYAIFSSLILDNGNISGHFARFLVILPLFVYRGYDLSAKSGL